MLISSSSSVSRLSKMSPLRKAALQAQCAGHARFLVDGEQGFEGGVLDV